MCGIKGDSPNEKRMYYSAAAAMIPNKYYRKAPLVQAIPTTILVRFVLSISSEYKIKHIISKPATTKKCCQPLLATEH